MVSGSNEFAAGAKELGDRLYLNDGKGNFTKGFNTGLMGIFGSSSAVAPIDLNADGALDLVVGVLVGMLLGDVTFKKPL